MVRAGGDVIDLAAAAVPGVPVRVVACAPDVVGAIATGEVGDTVVTGRVSADGSVVSMRACATDVATAASSVPAVSVVVIGNAADMDRAVAVGESGIACAAVVAVAGVDA